MPQPDKLFRDSLEHFQKPAPASAWNRIKSGLDSRQPKNIWLKIAAGLLLLIAVSYMLWPEHKIPESTTLHQTEGLLPEIKINTPIATVTHAPQKTATADWNAEPIAKNKIVSPPGKNIAIQQKTAPDADIASSGKDEVNKSVNSSEPVEAIADSEPVMKKESLPPSSEKNIAVHSTRANIFYTSTEVNARFLKKEITKEATPEKKATSGIKKVITIAMDIKNNDKIFGDLRQMKNELLTFNFPEKKRDPTK